MRLTNRHVIVAVSGSIAAYKSLELIRLLRKEGASVRVMTTPSALQFVGEISFEVLSGQKCLSDALSVDHGHICHIEEAQKSDVMVFAPATAHMLAKMAMGMADTLALQTLLSFRGPCVVAPAMESQMWMHEATQSNVAVLRARRCIVAGPNDGELASGRAGLGRMAEPEEIIDAVLAALSPQDFAGRRVLVTAGPTLEDIDPVRFIANRSSGKMGVALAKALAERGAEVCLIHGPMSAAIPNHRRIEAIAVRSAAQMHKHVVDQIDACSIAILCAAVADFKPAEVAESKIKKTSGKLSQLMLTPTIDILESIGKRQSKPFLVGFAAETENIMEEALRKCLAKGADLICGNDAVAAMDADTNALIIVDKRGNTHPVALASKEEVAHAVLSVIANFVAQSGLGLN